MEDQPQTCIVIKDEPDSTPTTTTSTSLTVSLKSILTEVAHADAAANQLCRRMRPLLDQNGIATFKKHHAVHVLATDAQRVKELGETLV